MELLHVKEYKKQLREQFMEEDTGLYIELLGGYTGYIDDAITEIADNNTEIYTKKLFDKSWDLYKEGYIDRSIEELGYTDLIKIFMGADYLKNTDVIYNNLDLMILYYAIDNNDINISIDKWEEFIELLESEIKENIDSNNYMEDIDDLVNECINDILD